MIKDTEKLQIKRDKGRVLSTDISCPHGRTFLASEGVHQPGSSPNPVPWDFYKGFIDH